MIPRRQCHGCFMPLDARAFCPRCEPAQVVCPKCSRIIKDGPNQKPNFQFCKPCLAESTDIQALTCMAFPPESVLKCGQPATALVDVDPKRMPVPMCNACAVRAASEGGTVLPHRTPTTQKAGQRA